MKNFRTGSGVGKALVGEAEGYEMPAAGHAHLVVVVYAHYAVLALQGVGVYVWPLGNGKFAVTPRLRRIFARRFIRMFDVCRCLCCSARGADLAK